MQRPSTERTVKVVRGDTLSGIAAKYAVSVDALVRSNSLPSKTIKVGQVLDHSGVRLMSIREDQTTRQSSGQSDSGR